MPQRFRAIFESAVDFAIIATDRNGRVTDWNPGAERVLGWSAGEMLGQPADRFFTPEDRAQGRPGVEMSLALTEGRANDERWHLRKDGSRLWAVGEMTALRGEAGEHLGFLKILTDRTAEHKAQAALQATEADLHRAQEAGGVGLFTLDVTSNTLRVTPEFCRLFGLPAREAYAAAEIEALFLRDGAETEHSTAESRRDGTLKLDAEYPIRRGDTGEIRWIARMAEIERDKAGSPVRIVGVVQDVTQRRRIEEQLRESQERFRNMAEHAPVMMWVTEPDGSCSYLNRAWYDFTGQTPEEAQGFGWLRATHPEDVEESGRIFLEANSRHEAFQIEYRLRHADGSYRWAIDAAAPRFGPGGEFLGYVGSVTDIHERKLSEEALERRVAERTAERDQLWRNAQDILAVVDRNGVLQDVNPAFTTILGWTWDEVVGRSAFDFIVHPEEQSQMAFQQAYLDVMPVIENCYRHKDGGVRWIAWVAAPTGELIYGSGRDVTEERRQRAELAAAQEQLRQSQKMEAMGSLTGGVAHDFNNLLTPIIGSLDRLVTRGVGSERERRLLAGALESAERAKTLVQRLLAFARRQPLQPVAVDVAALVQGMRGLLGSTLGPQIDLRVKPASDLPPARADAHQLEMALLNLAVNARDAMPNGGTLSIDTTRESVRSLSDVAGLPVGLKRGHYVRLAVSDTGTGMDAATLSRAVEPFFSTKGVGRGTGLGLSMVHGLAAQLGGGLSLESTPGQGTTIALWLPISAVAVEAGAEAASSSSLEPGTRGRALLVDDEDLVRMSTADMLEDLGFEVVEANSAEQALAVLQGDETLSLLVTDHLMPGMSGAELVHRARSLRPGLPALIVSGYADVEGIDPDLPRLIKPFRMSDFRASLAAMMEGRASQESKASQAS